MTEFVGSIAAFRNEEPGVVAVYHAALLTDVNSKEDAETVLLEKARAGWPESEEWYGHRVAVTNLSSLMDELAGKDQGFHSHALYVGSQYATQNRDDGRDEISIAAVSADSADYAEALFKDGMLARYPLTDGWQFHSINYKTITELRAEV